MSTTPTLGPGAHTGALPCQRTARTTPPAPVAGRASLPRLVRSEWTKFWSIRSTVATLAAAVLVMVGTGALLSLAISSSLAEPASDGGDVTLETMGLGDTVVSLLGVTFAQLVVVAVGVLTVTGEFTTGTLRTTFAADPRRLPTLAAKAVVLAAVVAVTSAVAVLLSFLLGEPLLAGQGADRSLGDPGVVGALAGTVAMLVGVALAGLGLGAVMRSAAGAISTMVALLLVVPTLLVFVPDSWGGEAIRRFSFSGTAEPFTGLAGEPGALAPWQGALAFAAWVLAFLAAGAVALRRRDA